MAPRIKRCGHWIKADGDANESDKERGRTFILDFLALMKHLLRSGGSLCLCDMSNGKVASLSGS